MASLWDQIMNRRSKDFVFRDPIFLYILVIGALAFAAIYIIQVIVATFTHHTLSISAQTYAIIGGVAVAIMCAYWVAAKSIFK